MDVTLLIHLESAGDGSPVWWAESEDLPGLTASADSLSELREALNDVFAELTTDGGQPIRVLSERLMGAEIYAGTPPGPTVHQDGQAPVEAVPSARQVLLVAA